MVKIFKTIPQNVGKPLTTREKNQKLITDIGGRWYLEKCQKGLPPLKGKQISKKAQKRQELIKKKLSQSNMWWNDWKFQLHCNMLEWVDPKTTPKRVKPFSVSSKKLYIDNKDRTAHFVGHSKLIPLDIIDFYERKQTNENMETEMKEMDDKLGKNAFLDDDNFDEAIPIQIIKEITTEAYKEKMNEDIETIDKNDNSKQIVQKLNGDQYMRL